MGKFSKKVLSFYYSRVSKCSENFLQKLFWGSCDKWSNLG